MSPRSALLSGFATAALLSACSQSDPPTQAQAKAPPPPAAAAKPAPAAQPAPAPATDASPQVAQINDAKFAPPAPDAAPASKPGKGKAAEKVDATPEPMLIKAQVLLARANFSPGEVDGLMGSNFRHAVTDYATANGLQSDGDLTQEVWDKLAAGSPPPVAATYTLADADVSGPWTVDTHDSISKDKGLPAMGFSRPTELLGEKFHMSEELLKALNPGVDFTKAGTPITVVQVGDLSLATVDHIQVDKAHAQLRAYDADGKILAMFPATVGSVDRPSPSGVHKVDVVKKDPLYTYDPKKLTWGPKKLGRFTIKAGPNNPVGDVWMGLNAPGYGLHGTPEPHTIGKTGSHGCVRMTNWDATLLSTAVKPGVQVAFLNTRKA